MHQVDFDFNLEEICKIEGDAGLRVKVRAGKVVEIEFSVKEYKRFFTQGMKGKNALQAPQFLSRICGTCSNAHLLASIKAVENALAIPVTDQTKILKKLAINGLMIRDHALHLYVFALPDLFKKASIVDFDAHDELEGQLLQDTLAVKSSGNKLQVYITGRSVHAPYLGVGGFGKTPQEDHSKYIESLEKIRPAVIRLTHVFMDRLTNFETKTNFVAMRGENAWEFLNGKIITSLGKTIEEIDFKEHLEHVVIPYSQASAYKHAEASYYVGALARINLNQDQLHPRTKQDLAFALEKFPSNNVFMNNVAQAIEILHCIDESIDLLKNHTFQKEEKQQPTKTSGTGVGVIEAPRGLLYHKVVIENMTVVDGAVIVPTGQNQIKIEEDIAKLIEDKIDLPQQDLELEIEKLIRSYDPCMSCAAHFLKVDWDIS